MLSTLQAAASPKNANLTAQDQGVWCLSGAWTLAHLPNTLGVRALPPATTPPITLDGSALIDMDSAGAWTLQQWLGEDHTSSALRAWPDHAAALMKEVQAAAAHPVPAQPHYNTLYQVGRYACNVGTQLQAFLQFIGAVSLAGARTLPHWRQWRFSAILHELQIAGVEALPIIGLTSFLLGVVVAYQGAAQLRHYGANVFVVELVGYAMLREFAPLMGAIIVAGRSGSAYAAQLGTMVVAQEMDALRTIGIDPLQRLVLPKMVALLVALPLLTVFADLAGVFGGMVMARTQLDIGFAEFSARFGRVMRGSALLLGVGKSLVFALIIASVGCFQGMRTQGSADSVGRQTTLSVVQSIFVVIVADALFSVAFNLLGL